SSCNVPSRRPVRSLGILSCTILRGGVCLRAITPATKIRTHPYSRFGPATADRGSRGIRDQPRNPPKYTEKRIRINFPFPCQSVLLTLNFFEPCANSWAKTKYEPLSIGSYKLFICQKLNAPNF